MLLSAYDLFHYQRCKRWAFLDVYGDRNHLDPPSDFLRKLQQDSSSHRQTVLRSLRRTTQSIHYRPYYRKGDWFSGAEATLALMRQGVDYILQGVLLSQHSEGITFMSQPDLLVKQPGESNLGDWLYVPMDIQLSKRAKLDYQVVGAFHAQILAAMQGTWPKTARLLLRDQQPFFVNLAKVLPLLEEIQAECIEMLRSRQEPEVFISRHPCTLCKWYSSCYAIAQSQQHLSLLPGVTPIRYTQLQQLNLTTVEALANADLSQLALALSETVSNTSPEDIASQLMLQARAVVTNQPLLKSSSRFESRTLPTAPVELYFDIEAQQDINLIYLHGVLVVDRLAQTQIFHPLVAESPGEEGVAWQQFLDLVQSYPDAPIFHFCDYEVQTVKQLAKRYQTPARSWKPLINRFVDIHEWVTETVVLPVDGYGLKNIARWLGFEWRDRNSNGGQCVFWYDQWLQKRDRRCLDAILLYNEDDCRATYVLKDWLANFLQPAAPMADELPTPTHL